jgi:hypothetical protein
MTTKINREAEFVFKMVMKLGGESNYSDSTKSAIWAECQKLELRNQALIYLSGSSERAGQNLYSLHTTIVDKFFTDPRTGEVTL